MKEFDMFSKVASIVQAALMYAIYLFFGLDLLLSETFENLPEAVSMILIVAAVLCVFGVLFVGFINMIVSAVNVFTGKENPLRRTMIIKLCLIPWYVLNFGTCALVVGGMLNPFFLLAIPIFVFLAFLFTFFFMVYTSIPSLFYLARLCKDGKLKMDAELIIYVVFHFIFVLDVIASVLLCHRMEKQFSKD